MFTFFHSVVFGKNSLGAYLSCYDMSERFFSIWVDKALVTTVQSVLPVFRVNPQVNPQFRFFE